MNTVRLFEMACSCLCLHVETTLTDLSAAPCPASLCTILFCDCPHVGHHVSFASWLRHVRRFCPHVCRHDNSASCVRRMRCFGRHVRHPDGFASRLRHVRPFTSDWSLTSPRWRNVISLLSQIRIARRLRTHLI